MNPIAFTFRVQDDPAMVADLATILIDRLRPGDRLTAHRVSNAQGRRWACLVITIYEDVDPQLLAKVLGKGKWNHMVQSGPPDGRNPCITPKSIVIAANTDVRSIKAIRELFLTQ